MINVVCSLLVVSVLRIVCLVMCVYCVLILNEVYGYFLFDNCSAEQIIDCSNYWLLVLCLL